VSKHLPIETDSPLFLHQIGDFEKKPHAPDDRYQGDKGDQLKRTESPGDPTPKTLLAALVGPHPGNGLVC
jgi:hypothetical protein